jgi:hypothetical protein
VVLAIDVGLRMIIVSPLTNLKKQAENISQQVLLYFNPIQNDERPAMPAFRSAMLVHDQELSVYIL